MYRAPVKDVRFVFRELVDESALQACSAFADYSPDLADAVLEEAAKFADNVLEPLCRSGDREAVHVGAPDPVEVGETEATAGVDEVGLDVAALRRIRGGDRAVGRSQAG